MTYNEKHFSPELNRKLNNKLNILLTWQNHVLDFQIKYLLASNEQVQLLHCDAFLQLLVKIRFNLEAVNALLPFLYDDYRFKTSINILYRSIIDDLINIYYLFGTVNLADPDQKALYNELNIFHKEFLLSSIKQINSDREFEKFINELKLIDSGPDIDVENEFRRANPELFNENGTWKKNSEIRQSTHPGISGQFNQNDGSAKSFISEAKKLEFIQAIGIPTHHNIAALFKYLSQYQHFSPKVHQLLNSDIEFDIEVYQRCLGEVVMLLDQLSQFLVLKDKNGLKAEWEAMAPLVFNSFADN